jgi:hypothetical protein
VRALHRGQVYFGRVSQCAHCVEEPRGAAGAAGSAAVAAVTAAVEVDADADVLLEGAGPGREGSPRDSGVGSIVLRCRDRVGDGQKR